MPANAVESVRVLAIIATLIEAFAVIAIVVELEINAPELK